MNFSKKNHSMSRHFGKHHVTIKWMVSKTKIFTLLTILISFFSFSQNTYVPDDNFEQALIDLGYDTVLDDYVTTANISGVPYLDVESKNISNLTGIEDFTALTTLNCKANQLTNLDVTQNTALIVLNCFNNALTSLDITQNIALEYLFAGTNQLSSLDVSQNTALKSLGCNVNQLTSLDVSQNTVLTSLVCNTNALSSLDVTQNTSLELLNCAENQLSNLNVSQNTNLEYLYVFTNQLTNLDVTQNTDLILLTFANNSLTNLDVTQNIALTNLYCDNNLLTSLDVSQNSGLVYLDVTNNDLVSLNVKNGNNTSFTNFWANDNPDLTCIEVDDASYSTANWTNIDAQTSFSEDCRYGETYVPDDNFEQALIDLGYDTVLDDYVTTSNISGVTNLNVSNKSIADLTGIEDFAALASLNCKTNYLTNLDLTHNTALTQLDCRTNQLSTLDITQNTLLEHLDAYNNLLTSLDVSQNTALTLLSCGTNQITSIDVAQNTALTQLYIENNLLTSLDLSQNTALTHLFCYSNQLTSLNVKNNNNTNVISFLAYTNPDLYCIEVDDEAYSTANWTNIDMQTSFSEDCSTLSITDSELADKIVVYPNPTSDIIHIDTKLELTKIELFDIVGKHIITLKENMKQLNVDHLKAGIYLLTVHSNNGKLTRKIVVE